MRVDAVTIFPAYLEPLSLSLMGRAQRNGALDLHVHDLREATCDRHRTVDDTPFGGGAGMVMTPEPWAVTLERLVTEVNSQVDGETPPRRPRLLVPSPSGRVLDQAFAAELAAEPWLIFACGRYEGIDERVLEWAADPTGLSAEVTAISLGDYVLCGGEAAVLVVLEAVVRLLPAVLGNADSLTEESHTGGLLEYPLFTKPASWRGRAVPAVLLSGDHAAIAAWRHEQRVRRTAERRPDLLGPGSAVVAGLPAGAEVRPATAADAGELFTLQRACWLAEAQDNPGVDIPALGESLTDVEIGLREWTTLVVRLDGRLIASGRGRSVAEGTVWDIGRLMVAPDLQGRGLGKWALEATEALAPPQVQRYELFTGANSADNLRMYRRAGYRPIPGDVPPGAIRLGRRRR